MSSVLSVKLLDGKDKFSQKCIIPFHIFEKNNLKIGDYVTLKMLDKVYICRIYTTVEELNHIYVDDVITCTNSYLSIKKGSKNINFPDDFAAVKPSIFNRITVKIIFKENNCLKCDKASCQNAVHKILSRYVIGKQCIVNCRGLKIADLFNIQSIMIVNTFPEENMFGRLIKTSNIEIVDVMSWEQLLHISKYKNFQLSGVNDAMNLLEWNLNCALKTEYSSILVCGPSGCGKSSIVNFFCQIKGCFFIIIDGSKEIDLNIDKCNKYSEQFSSYLKMFPDKTCVLFIDDIDAIASYNSNEFLPSIIALVTLINSLKNLHVFIVATASHRENLIPSVSTLFVREVIFGMPSLEQRKEIIEVLTMSLNCDVDCDKIARMTPGFVGQDLSVLIKEAISIILTMSLNCDVDCDKIARMTPGFVGQDLSVLIKEAISISKKEISQTADSKCLTLTTDNFVKALANISPSALKTSLWKMKVKPVDWKDIGGMFHVKKRVQMCVEWPLSNPEVFKKVDLPCPRGILLYGPPGCCKTTLARRLATEYNANFFAANPAEIYSCYVGESEKNIVELFNQARLCSPSIIFLDELDSLVSQRKLDTKNQGVGEKVLSALLNEMDGFGTKVQFQSNLNMQKLLKNGERIVCINEKVGCEPRYNDDVIVVAATNRPDLIDDALLRPGRFDIILYVSPPDCEERESILQTLTEGISMKDVNLKRIAENTNLFSGADLKNLHSEASMNALRNDISAPHVTEENFNEALTTLQPSITKQQLEMYEKLSSKYGSVIKSF